MMKRGSKYEEIEEILINQSPELEFHCNLDYEIEDNKVRTNLPTLKVNPRTNATIKSKIRVRVKPMIPQIPVSQQGSNLRAIIEANLRFVPNMGHINTPRDEEEDEDDNAFMQVIARSIREM